jgi:hypothetical protein
MRTLGLIAVAVLLLGGSAPAQAETAHWFGYHAGQATTTGDFREAAAHYGYNLGATYTYMLNRYVGVGGELEYYNWTLTPDLKDAVHVVYGSDARMKLSDWQGTLHAVVVLPVPGPVQPFAKAGWGYYDPKGWLYESGEEWHMGQLWYGHVLGGGVNVRLSDRLALGAVGAVHEYRDGHQEWITRYWSMDGQILWRMNWGAKL